MKKRDISQMIPLSMIKEILVKFALGVGLVFCVNWMFPGIAFIKFLKLAILFGLYDLLWDITDEINR